ncbi:hypothetical protein ACLB2K_043525 [Fragaria x ananassa]
MPSSNFDFLFHIFIFDVAGNKDSTTPESSRKRKLRDDHQMSVSFMWNVFRKCYCSDDRSRRVVDLDFLTAEFKDLKYQLFTFVDEDDIGVIDQMITKIGRPLYGGAKFEEVNEMVHQVRQAVVKAFQTGSRREKLDVMVTVQNQVGMPVDEYEEVLRDL